MQQYNQSSFTTLVDGSNVTVAHVPAFVPVHNGAILEIGQDRYIVKRLARILILPDKDNSFFNASAAVFWEVMKL